MRKLKISVNNPCSELWEEMKPSGENKFCQQCSKSVYNLTHLTDKDILKFIDNNGTTFCGRFSKQQLNREIVLPRKNKFISSYFSKIALGFLFTSVFDLAKIKASDTVPLNDYRIHQVKFDSLSINKKALLDKVAVKGAVKDSSDQLPLVGVSVFVRKLKIGVSTDLDGKFELIIPEKHRNDSIIVEFSYMGYKTVSYSFGANQVPSNLSITLCQSDEELKGVSYISGIAFCSIVTSRKKRWWRFWQ